MKSFAPILAITVASFVFSHAAAQEQDDDPFAIFNETENKKKEAAPAAPKKPTAQPQAAPTPASRNLPAALNLYCYGNMNRYTGQNLMETNAFEFITAVDTRTKQHTIRSVTKGKLMQVGSTYSVQPINSALMVLSAQSSAAEWDIPTLQLNLETGKLDGTGTVDMSAKRREIVGRLEESGINARRSRLLSGGGLDSMRRIAVDGYCQAIES